MGVVVVHGIGEQRRFQHVDAEVRAIVGALAARGDLDVTTEIAPGQGGVFQAEQDSWAAGPDAPVRVTVRRRDGSFVELNFHEVWWADVNEPYSLAKQFRFWAWGLAVWTYPGKARSSSAGARDMRPPNVGSWRWFERAWVRVRLYGVALVAVLGAASIGLVSFFAQRVLNVQPPRLVRTFANYVSGVKLYNQRRRFGGGILWDRAEFLDALDDPPRVSVRRRMIRAVAEVALRRYDRWYVVAHSLGSVVAFNGLMEVGYAWPGYLTRSAWDELVAGGFAGPAQSDWRPPEGDPMSPRRPVWVGSRDLVYRSAVFERFHGFLTYGCPLEKFAALWPARVPISAEKAFRAGTAWFNVYDPTDPVAGVIRSFGTPSPHDCPPVMTLGYAAHPFLLLSHVRYMSRRRGASRAGDGTLVSRVAAWLLDGDHAALADARGPLWFSPFRSAPAEAGRRRSGRHWRRTALAASTWVVVAAGLALLGGWVMRQLVERVSLVAEIGRRLDAVAAALVPTAFATSVEALPIWLGDAAKLVCFAVALPLVVGALGRSLFRRDRDDVHVSKRLLAEPVGTCPEPVALYERPWHVEGSRRSRKVSAAASLAGRDAPIYSPGG